MELDKTSGTKFLKVSGIQSIKTKILIFALLATIMPSLILGGLSYLNNREILQAKIANELDNAAVQAGGKLNLWLRARTYDLKVFSSSYIIAENIIRITGPQPKAIDTLVGLNHIKGYLQSVCDKFSVYDELIVLDLAGKALITSAPGQATGVMPTAWLGEPQADPSIIADTYSDGRADTQKLLLAEPIRTSDGRPLGYLAAKIKLKAIGELLSGYAVNGVDEIYLVDAKGSLMTSSRPVPAHLRNMKPSIPSPHVSTMQSKLPAMYKGFREKPVMGMATPIPSMKWVMVAEMERDRAYAEIGRLRRLTALLVGGLMLCVGVLAYLFGHALVRPVQRLSNEATRVAAGNLDVDIPVSGLSEVSYLTQVFNHMVASLRRGREKLSSANAALRKSNAELQHLSITDGLTGLLNRRRITHVLEQEIYRSQRYDHSVSILMLDIDYFKKINDTHGHQTGDTVLCLLADLFRDLVRDSDYVGRYGGEEFLVVLSESDAQSSLETAERIRQKAAQLQIPAGQEMLGVTVSIGVATYPSYGEDADTLICAADGALYQAKADGRNRVVIKKSDTCQKAEVVSILAQRRRG